MADSNIFLYFCNRIEKISVNILILIRIPNEQLVEHDVDLDHYSFVYTEYIMYSFSRIFFKRIFEDNLANHFPLL